MFRSSRAGLIEDYLRDEIYYREALAMGLDKDDATIRRQMRQKLEPGDWTGPVISGLGGHLVMVSERKDGRMPELAEVRAIVDRDWLARRQKELKDVTFRKFLERYEVVMEQPAKQSDASGTAVAATPAEAGPQ